MSKALNPVMATCFGTQDTQTTDVLELVSQRKRRTLVLSVFLP